MASFGPTAFDTNAFSVAAFDFGTLPTFNPAFSDGAFGRNTAFSDQAFSFAVTPPIPAIPTIAQFPGILKGGEDDDRVYKLLRRRFEKQNADDLEVVRILTEFLWRIS